MNPGSSFASTFAPYAPPPDDPAQTGSTSRSAARTLDVPHRDPNSYQSGAVPTLSNRHSLGSSGVSVSGFGNDPEAQGPATLWQTRLGVRVDMLAMVAYFLGPISALLILILETHNDYVRFHAYQSSLAITPLLLMRIFGSIVGLPSFLLTILTFLILFLQVFMMFRAYIDANRNHLSRYYLPYIGPLAEQWLSEE